jgi:hypothetical protein
MADVRITALPTAQAITGSELVPVVQNGLTVQTTVSAITSSPSLTQTFLTVVQQPTLPNSRYFSTGVGLGITDGGAQGSYTIAFNGTAASLESSGTGFIAKTAANTITPRSFVSSGAGVSIANGTGISGDPTISLSGLPLALANTVGSGLLAVGVGPTLTPVTITGTSNQIDVTGGDGSSPPTISISPNPQLSGTGAVRVPLGTTAQQPSALSGNFRLNTDTNVFEGYNNTGWVSLLSNALNNTSISGVKTITFNGQVNNAATSGAITIDWTTGNYQLQAAPSGTITYTFTAPVGVSHLQLFVAPAALAQMIIWPANLYFLGATWSGTNNKAAIINFYYDGTNYYAIGTNQV